MAQTSTSAFDYAEAHKVNGIHTEIVLHRFANKHLLFITQFERLNNILVACNELAFNGIMRSNSLNVKHLFGTTSDEIECGIKFLLSNTTLDLNKDTDVVICLGLKEYGPKVLKQLKTLLDSIDKKGVLG